MIVNHIYTNKNTASINENIRINLHKRTTFKTFIISSAGIGNIK